MPVTIFPESEGTDVETADNVAALKALPVAGLSDGQVIATRGYYTENDGGQGTYIYDSGSVAADNGGTVIAPTVGAGRYLLVHTGTVSLAQFGAKGDAGVTDNSPFMTAAVATLNAGTFNTLFVPAGNFYVNGSYSLTGNNITIVGVDRNGTSLITAHRTTTGNTALFRVYGLGISFLQLGLTRSDNPDTPASPVAYMKFWRLENTVRNFRLERCYIDGNATGQIYRAAYYYVEIDAFGVTSTPGGGPQDIWILDNYWTDTSSRALDLCGVRNVIIRGNYFYKCGINNYTAVGNTLNPGTCVQVSSFDTGATINWSYNVVVSGNTFLQWGDGAINYAGVQDSAITGNTCAGAATIGEEYVTAGAGYAGENGIAIFGGRNITIAGNCISKTKEWGIYARSQAKGGIFFLDLTDITITGNICQSGTSPLGNALNTGITISSLEAGVSVVGVVVSSNSYATTDSRANPYSITCSATSTLRCVTMASNVIIGASSAGPGNGISVAFNAGATTSGVIIDSNIIRSFLTGIYNASNWDNSTQVALNNISDCTTLVSNSASLGIYTGQNFIAVRGSATTALALDGAIRLPNGQAIMARNNASSGQITMLDTDTSDRVRLNAGTLLVGGTNNVVQTSSTGKLVLAAPSIVSVTAGATLNSSATTLQVVGSGGAVTLSNTTGISAGVANGQILIIGGTDDVNTVTVPAAGNLYLDGGAACVLGRGDTIMLVYFTAGTGFNAGWREICRSNNPQ